MSGSVKMIAFVLIMASILTGALTAVETLTKPRITRNEELKTKRNVLAALDVPCEEATLEFSLAPVPMVKLKTLRGREITFGYDQAPMVDGRKIDYAKWQLFEGHHLNAARGSKKLTITHGRLERVLDFNTLTITDRVKEN